MHVRFMVYLLLLALVSARGEIWQSPHWAAIGIAEGSTGYDSNLTLSDDGEGSAFVSAAPAVLLRRHSSATKLDLRLGATLTYFADDSEFQTDSRASLDYAYPEIENALPRFTGSAHWMRFTAGHASLGRRITATASDANFGGRLFSTGKLGVTSRVELDRQDYSEENLNTNQRGTLAVGVSYAPDPNKEITLQVVAGLAASDPNAAGFARVRSREWGVLLEGRGNLARKITGALRAGVAAIRYRGAFRRSDVLPVAGGDVTWQANERARLMVSVDVGADFSPTGESLAVHRLTLAYDQTIRGPWRMQARVIPALTNYYQDTRVRQDRSFGGGLSLIYRPSERFDVSLAHDFTTQRSDQPFARFERFLTTANLSYRF